MGMKTTTLNHPNPSLWSRILLVVGGVAMLAGAIDPMEGSLLILPGSGLFALGTFLGHYERRIIHFRVLVFILIAIGVGAMWGLTSVGGFGGSSGHTMWWGLLMLPYLIGWSMGIWGPGSPRWLVLPGIAVSLLYLAMPLIVLFATHKRNHPATGAMLLAPIIMGVLGALTIVGCVFRLRHRQSQIVNSQI
jgi:hypothetical protein